MVDRSRYRVPANEHVPPETRPRFDPSGPHVGQEWRRYAQVVSEAWEDARGERPPPLGDVIGRWAKLWTVEEFQGACDRLATAIRQDRRHIKNPWKILFTATCWGVVEYFPLDDFQPVERTERRRELLAGRGQSLVASAGGDMQLLADLIEVHAQGRPDDEVVALVDAVAPYLDEPQRAGLAFELFQSAEINDRGLGLHAAETLRTWRNPFPLPTGPGAEDPLPDVSAGSGAHGDRSNQ